MSSQLNLLFVVFVTVALGGCAKNSQLVDRRMILPPLAAVVEVEDDQQFMMAVSIDSPSPLFPDEVGNGNLRADVCARFIVTREGSVEGIEIVRDLDGCAVGTGGEQLRFEQSVRDALSRWTFFGAALCRFPSGVAKNEDCEGDGVVIEPVPIRLMYVFSFEQVSGRRTVGTKKTE